MSENQKPSDSYRSGLPERVCQHCYHCRRYGTALQYMECALEYELMGSETLDIDPCGTCDMWKEVK